MICGGHQLRLDHWVTRWFRRYGELIGRHPTPFILTPLITAVILSIFIIFIRLTVDVTPLFLSDNVPSLLETRIFMEFTAYTAARYYLDVLIVRKNRGPLLNDFYGQQHVSIAQDLFHNISVRRGSDSYTLADLCQLATCWSGREFISDFHNSFNNPDTKVSPNLKFGFPVMEAFGTKVPLWSIIGNVTMNDRHSVQQAHLLRVVTSVTLKTGTNRMDSAELRDTLRGFGLQFDRHFSQAKYADLQLYTYYNDAIEPATAELSMAIVPELTVSLILLGLFTIASCMTGSYRTSKGPESIAGILNTFMAYGSAIGLITVIGGRDYGWNSSLCVTPFLVLAIGVDDMFVLISSWNRTDKNQSVPERMGDLMADGSVSILITSLTNVVSFAVGISQTTPAVKLFSIYTSVALSLEFFYQMTFFLGVLAYGGYREKDELKWFWPRIPCRKNHKVTGVSAEKLYDYNQSTSESSKPPASPICKRLLLKLLYWRVGRCVIVTLFSAILMVSVYGCTLIQVNFAPRKLVLSESNFERYYDLADKTVFKDSLVAYVTVNRPPNISDPNELRRFYEFVKSLEQLPHAVGSQSTELWLNDYLLHTAKLQPLADSLALLPEWLGFPENRRWKDAVVHTNSTNGHVQLMAFQFVTLYSDLGQFYQKNQWLTVLRDTYARYGEFNVSVYTDFSYYADQVLTLPDNVMQDAAMATIVIAVISFCMVPNAGSMFWVIYIVLVIEAGVVSCLKFLFDADLDPITMITITMAVGFSVEYNLHVSHFFYTSKATGFRAKTAESIEAIGWPVVQSSISTLLGVSGLILVPAYIPRIFFATIVTVVILGLLHSMLLLPLLLGIFATSEHKSAVSSGRRIGRGRQQTHFTTGSD